MTPEIYVGLSIQSKNKFRKGAVNTIIDSVSEILNVTVESIKSQSRKRDIVEARQICIGLVLEHDKLISLSKLGQILGGRDHSTMIYSRQTYNDLYQTNKIFKEKVNSIKKQALI